jgi:hypothetical protein
MNNGWPMKNGSRRIHQISRWMFTRSARFFLVNKPRFLLYNIGYVRFWTRFILTNKLIWKAKITKTSYFQSTRKAKDLRRFFEISVALLASGKYSNDTADRPRTIRTKATIQKVKAFWRNGKCVASRKLARRLAISRMSVQRILRHDLGLKSYAILQEPSLAVEHKEKRLTFSNWIRVNFRQENTMRFLFSDGDSVRHWWYLQEPKWSNMNRGQAACQPWRWYSTATKISAKVIGVVGCLLKWYHSTIDVWKRTVDHARYIKEVLPLAVKYENKMFGNDWIFQQNGAKPHTHVKSETWCEEHLP